MPKSIEQIAVRAATDALYKHMLAHAPPRAQPDPEAVRDMVQVVANAMRESEHGILTTVQVHDAPAIISFTAIQEAYERGLHEGRSSR